MANSMGPRRPGPLAVTGKYAARVGAVAVGCIALFEGGSLVVDLLNGTPPVVTGSARWIADTNSCDATGATAACVDTVKVTVKNVTKKPAHITLALQVATNDSQDNGGSPGFVFQTPNIVAGTGTPVGSASIDLGTLKPGQTATPEITIPSDKDPYGGQFLVSLNGKQVKPAIGF
jgi:hypothetical protein